MDLIAALEDHQLWLVTYGNEGARAILDEYEFSVRLPHHCLPINPCKTVMSYLLRSGATEAACEDIVLTMGTDVRISFAGASLRGARFSPEFFGHVAAANARDRWIGPTDFSGADLSGARLEGCDLQRAMFTRGDLSGTNFHAASLGRATFQAANLRNADLSKTSLRRAEFKDADIHGANFNDALGWHLGDAINREFAHFNGTGHQC